MDEALENELTKFDAELQAPLRLAYKTPADKRTAEQKKLLDEQPQRQQSDRRHALSVQSRGGRRVEEDRRRASRPSRAKKPVQDFVPVLTEVPGQIPPDVPVPSRRPSPAEGARSRPAS